MTVIVRRIHIRTRVGASQTDINVLLPVRLSFAVGEVATATLPVQSDPGLSLNDRVTVELGAGTNNVGRFDGLYRDIHFDLAGHPSLICAGKLILAAQYENSEDPGGLGGLGIADLTGGSDTADDQTVVRAALTKAGVSFTSGNIDGTGRLFGTIAPVDVFVWSAGNETSLNPGRINVAYRGAGESALDFIKRWDQISASWNGSGSGGFYTTFESLSGTVYRTLIGGRSRSTADFTFTEGIDIADGGSAREYPAATRVLVHGYDDGTGAVEFAEPTDPSGQKTFVFPPSSMIEFDTVANAAGSGMDAETVANAAKLDVDRQTVELTMTTPLDSVIGPGQTHLVQGAGGLPARLGIGEKLWARRVEIVVSEQRGFRQTITYVGGGVDDPGLPDVGT